MALFTTIIWDMDGVLVDSERHWDEMENFFLKEAIPEWERFDTSLLVGRSLHDIYDLLTEEYGLAMSREEYVQKYNRRAKTIYGEKADLMPNAESALQILSTEGAVQALVSSSTREWIGYAMERFKLGKYFEVIISSDDVKGKGKPAPDIYEHACWKLDIGKENILVIEDSEPGVTAAKHAGLAVALYPSKENMESEFQQQADYVIHDLLEVPLLRQQGQI